MAASLYSRQRAKKRQAQQLHKVQFPAMVRVPALVQVLVSIILEVVGRSQLRGCQALFPLGVAQAQLE